MMYFLLTATGSFSMDSGIFSLTKSSWKLTNTELSLCAVTVSSDDSICEYSHILLTTLRSMDLSLTYISHLF